MSDDWPDDEENDNAQIYRPKFVKFYPKNEEKPSVKVAPMPKAESWSSGQFNGLADILKKLGVENLVQAVEKSKGDK